MSIATALAMSLNLGVFAAPISYLESPSLLEVATLSEGVENNVWDIHITNIQTKEFLETQETVTLYSGDTQDVNYTKKLKEGYEYLLLSLYVNKMEPDDSVFFSSEVHLIQSGTIISQSDNSFLGNHSLTSFTKNENLFGTSEGYLLFEVPAGTNLDGLSLETAYKTLKLQVTEPFMEKHKYQ